MSCYMKNKLHCILLIFPLILCNCVANKAILNIANQDIYKKGVSPNYDKWIQHLYKLEVKLDYVPFKNVSYAISKRYGSQNMDNLIDTTKISHGPSIYEYYLDKNGYIKIKKVYLENGKLYYIDSLFYILNPNNQIAQLKLTNSRWQTSCLIWDINYSKSGLIKNFSIKKKDSLILKRQYKYDLVFNHVKSITHDNKKVIQKTIYYFGHKWDLNKIVDQRFLNKTIKNSDFVYDSSNSFVINWFIKDSTKVTLESGFEKINNGQIVESYSQNEKYSFNSYNLRFYNNKGLVVLNKFFNSLWADKDTSQTITDYIIDDKNKIYTTIEKHYCKSCTGDKMNMIVVKFK